MFIESPRLPDDISFGFAGGPEFVTEIATNPGGYSFANATRDMPLYKFDASYGVRTHDQFLVLKRLFLNVKGKWGGFRVKDWSDFSFDDSTGTLVPVSPGVYQLTNSYLYGGITFFKPIKKPVVGTTRVKRGGTSVAAGVAAGNFVIDTTTGLVSFSADQRVAVSSITLGTSTVLALASSLGSVTSLVPAGFSGADAALLNGIQFAISGVSGLNYTIAVNTTGKDISRSGGSTAATFVQGTDGLTASSEFDLPMRFDTDFMQTSMDYTSKLHTWGQIPLIELRNPS